MNHFLALERFMFYGNPLRISMQRTAGRRSKEKTVARWIAKTILRELKCDGFKAVRRKHLLRINAATPRHTLRLFRLVCALSC